MAPCSSTKLAALMGDNRLPRNYIGHNLYRRSFISTVKYFFQLGNRRPRFGDGRRLGFAVILAVPFIPRPHGLIESVQALLEIRRQDEVGSATAIFHVVAVDGVGDALLETCGHLSTFGCVVSVSSGFVFNCSCCGSGGNDARATCTRFAMNEKTSQYCDPLIPSTDGVQSAAMRASSAGPTGGRYLLSCSAAWLRFLNGMPRSLHARRASASSYHLL